jgi:two-component system, OmpR family, sensor histidine kinase TctE
MKWLDSLIPTNRDEESRAPLQWASLLLLRRKLLVWLLSPLVLLMVVDGLASYYVAEHFSSVAYDRTLAERARTLLLRAQEVGGQVRLNLSQSAEQVLLEDTEDRIFYRVLREDAHLVPGETYIPLPANLKLQPNHPFFFNSVVANEPVRAVVLQAPYEKVGGASNKGQVRIVLAETLNKRRVLFQESLAGVVMPQVLIVILVGSLVWLGVVRGLAPLRVLERSIASRSHLDLSPVLLDGVPGRVRPLVDEINGLMARLSEVLEFQNRFIADAAHQLRTPVAGLKAQIEIVLRENDPERIKYSMTQIYMGMERLSRLVSQLLSLARNEPNAVRNLRLELIDLNRLIFEATMEWVPEALRKGIDLGFEGDDKPVYINGDPIRLKELINNLFDNAIRYTPDNGRVTARALRDPYPAFALSDDGPAIPVEERKRVFERFHRLLGSNTEGSGLGLAIVNEIAKIHSAEVSLMEDRDGVGNTFIVSFPALDSAFSLEERNARDDAL